MDAFLDSVPHRLVALFLALVAVACGILGVIAGWQNRALKLGELGWFGGGTIVALLAAVVLLDLLAPAGPRR